MKTYLILLLALLALLQYEKPPIKERVILYDAELHKELVKKTELLSLIFNKPMERFTQLSTPVTITAYSAREEECDSKPWITASGALVRIGIIACSRDLLKDYGLALGDNILLFVTSPIGVTECIGLFSVNDTMSSFKRKNTKNPKPIVKTVDILMANAKAAKKWGVKQGFITWVIVK